MIALSIYVLVESWGFYTNQRMPVPFYNSPGFFPFILGCALLICAVIMLIRSVSGGAFFDNFKKLKDGGLEFIKSPTAYRSAIGISWMGIYIFVLLPRLSFIFGTIVFLLVMITALMYPTFDLSDKKATAVSMAKIVAIILVSVFSTYGLFAVFFGVPLP